MFVAADCSRIHPSQGYPDNENMEVIVPRSESRVLSYLYAYWQGVFSP